jgi:hypothetical protein
MFSHEVRDDIEVVWLRTCADSAVDGPGRCSEMTAAARVEAVDEKPVWLRVQGRYRFKETVCPMASRPVRVTVP